MNNITIGNKKEIDGIEFHEVEGGFGEGKKCILAKEIANIHGKELKHINELINKNRNFFEDNIDIIDIKPLESLSVVLNDRNIYTKDSTRKSKNIYLLSEQGYMLLVKLMNDEKSKEIHKKLVREYFNMRKELKEVANILTDEQKLQLAIFNAKDKQDAILASAELDRFRQKQLAIAKPKTDYYDIVMDSQFLAKASDIGAKFDMSARKLNKILKEMKIIYKKGSIWYLYQQYKGNDYVAYPETEYTPQMKYTKKGVKFVIDLLIENGYEINNDKGNQF